ncbi:hypothetical protein [Magnetospira sp. QH-2]|uniref:hypothetical protein n=1 Tax=Magnetospira sp. (strain QH-2) TaxID=1288970 RepID=UPI0005F9CDF7|nr:hypothetical protein [Magnetospira sp. QH-2]
MQRIVTLISAIALTGALAACQTTGSSTSTSSSSASSGSSDVAKVVAQVKSDNDFAALCAASASNPAAGRQAVTNAVGKLVAGGEIDGSPGQVGQEAGKQIAMECRR